MFGFSLGFKEFACAHRRTASLPYFWMSKTSRASLGTKKNKNPLLCPSYIMDTKDLLLVAVLGISITLLFVSGEITGQPFIREENPYYGVRTHIAMTACCRSCDDVSSCYTTTQGKSLLKIRPCNDWEVECRL